MSDNAVAEGGSHAKPPANVSQRCRRRSRRHHDYRARCRACVANSGVARHVEELHPGLETPEEVRGSGGSWDARCADSIVKGCERRGKPPWCHPVLPGLVSLLKHGATKSWRRRDQIRWLARLDPVGDHAQGKHRHFVADHPRCRRKTSAPGSSGTSAIQRPSSSRSISIFIGLLSRPALRDAGERAKERDADHEKHPETDQGGDHIKVCENDDREDEAARFGRHCHGRPPSRARSRAGRITLALKERL
jgi:hypothetical protein